MKHIVTFTTWIWRTSTNAISLQNILYSANYAWMKKWNMKYEKVPQKQLVQPPPFDSLIWKSNGTVIASKLWVDRASISEDKIVWRWNPVFFKVHETYIDYMSVRTVAWPYALSYFLTWFINRDSWFENSRRRWARSCWALSCFSSYCLWNKPINRQDFSLLTVTYHWINEQLQLYVMCNC